MLKKCFLLVLCGALIVLAGCHKAEETLSVEKGSEPPVTVEEPATPEPTAARNPLTGLENLKKGKEKDRPVAIAINNISIAQSVQAGVQSADIVYETEVEGGITRLLAVFQDVSKAENIGSIRSARYVFVDLALGHNALYIHHGQDPVYCKPHLADIDDVNLSTNNYGFRLKNGLASEHTLYTSGEKLWKGMVKDGRKTENTETGDWATFADKDSPVSFESTAKTVTVPFSGSYHSVFRYNKEKKAYTRYFGSEQRKDYFNNKVTRVKNVFVLLTSIQNYPDGYHRQVSLEGGSGYYCVNGTYTPIKWSKGGAKNGFAFTTEGGEPLQVNPGKSWVCIASKSKSTPSFE